MAIIATKITRRRYMTRIPETEILLSGGAGLPEDLAASFALPNSRVLHSPLRDDDIPGGQALKICFPRRWHASGTRAKGITTLVRLLATLSLSASIILGCDDGQPPNVVMVLIDTLRPDHLGLHGYQRETAPLLSQLGRDSVVFLHAFSSSSWTAPATASLFTGLYPNHHGVDLGFVANLRKQRNGTPATASIKLRRLPENISTLPEILGRHGYRSFGLASNINIGPEIGFDRGMERLVRRRQDSAEDIVSQLLSWEAEIKSSEPFFLYLHLNDVHWPYTPQREWYPPGSGRLSELEASYDNEIRSLDESLARLAEHFVDDRTLLVILSDHGEEFGDHGSMQHGVSLYRELNQILLLIRGPGLGVPGRKVTTPVSIVDILPTVLELAGLPPSDERDGRSLARLWRTNAGVEGDRERPVFAHRRDSSGQRQLWSVVRGPWKLIQGRRTTELFDRFADPRELDNVVANYPEVARELGDLVERFRASSRRYDTTTSEVEIEPALLEELRSLGYVNFR